MNKEQIAAQMKKPVVRLLCSCCGGETRGRQWPNRDTGYGLCNRCIDFVGARNDPGEVNRNYGQLGVHYGELPDGQYYAPDGTLMNADGTRSIFDDVDE